MEKYFEILQDNHLFSGISPEELSSMLSCLGTTQRSYQKGAVLLLAGQPVDFIGLVVVGQVKLVKEDRNGNQSTLAMMAVGELFGESLACIGTRESPVSVVATQDTTILTFDYRKILTTCPTACTFHSRLIENLLAVIAMKNMQLHQTIEVLSKRTLREKLLCCLDDQRRGARQFTLNMNREELASYLCSDRSAVSAQLSKMQQEGLIRYHKNRFEWLME